MVEVLFRVEDDEVHATVWASDGQEAWACSVQASEVTPLGIAVAAGRCFEEIAERLRREQWLQPEEDWWTTVR